MIEILQFIFSSFWRFIGVALLLVIVCEWTPIYISIKHERKEDKADGSKDE